MRGMLSGLSLALLALLSQASALAGVNRGTDLMDLDLQTLMTLTLTTESGGFFEMEERKAPGQVIVLNRERIRYSAGRSMHELFDMYVPGVSMSYHFFGSLIGHRGVSIDANPKTAFMIDGKNVNARYHMGYMLPLDVPLLGDLQKIELVQGPGAIPHGSGAISGAVNMITRTGADQPGLAVGYEYGPIDGLHKTEAAYGSIQDEGDLFMYFGTLTADGFRPRTGNGIFNHDTEALAVANHVGVRLKKYVNDNYKATLNWNRSGFNLLAQFMTYHGISNSVLVTLYQRREDAAGDAVPFEHQQMSSV